MSLGAFAMSPCDAIARHPDPAPAHTREVISDRAPDRASPVTGETSWKAALHVHGSLSEGDATVATHHEAARQLGVDVIWWTDHDHMIVSEQHRATRFSFDAFSESLAAGEPWTPNWAVDIALPKSVTLFRNAFQEFDAVITDERVAQGTRSLKMSGRREFANRNSFMYLFNAQPTRRRISLAAGLTLRLKVFPESISADATGVMTMILSRTADPNVVTPLRLEIQYYLSNSGEAPHREDHIYRVPVPYIPGQWNEIVMPITQDAIAGYPFLDGEDQALTEVLVGLESKNNALAVCYYDDLRLDIEADGVPLFAKQKAMLTEYNALDEGVTHHQGIEHSSVLPHMLEYGPGTPLPDWVAYFALSPGVIDGYLVNGAAHNNFISSRITALAHERGAAVSYAHPFGTGTPLQASTPTKEQLLAKLLATNTFNSDLLEVGYRQRERPMVDHLWVWDQLALHNKVLTGLGVSDAHSGVVSAYLTDPTFSMVQFIYADANDEQTLADALRAGRTYYADPVIFDGELEIVADNGALMGDVVVTDRPVIPVTVIATGLTPGDELRLIDTASPAGSAIADEATLTVHTSVSLETIPNPFLRFEVHSQVPDRTEKAFSNPMYFLRDVPGEGVDWRRAFVDVAGVVASGFDHFRLTGVSASPSGNGTALAISGFDDESHPGAFDIDLSRLDAAFTVELEPTLQGRIVVDGRSAHITGLLGQGAVVIRVAGPCPADIDNSGAVGIDDLNALLAQWGQAMPAFTGADLNGDAGVGIDDLNVLLANWGSRCLP